MILAILVIVSKTNRSVSVVSHKNPNELQSIVLRMEVKMCALIVR